MVPFRPEFIAYVNLDHRTDRRAHMERLLKDAPCPVERVPATRLDGPPEAHGIGMIAGLEGQVGPASIFLSHRDALRRAEQRVTDGPFLLLEDDIHFGPDVWSRDFGLGLMPPDWDIVYVAPRFRNRVPRLIDWLSPRVGLSAQTFTNPGRVNRPMPAARLLRDYIITGSHFVVFRNRDAIRKVLARMESLSGVDHVDHFYAEAFDTHVIRDRRIRAGDFGTDLHAPSGYDLPAPSGSEAITPRRGPLPGS